MPTLKEQRATLLDQATTIITTAKSDGDRPLSDDEQTRASTLLDQVAGLDVSIKRSERSAAILDQFSNANGADTDLSRPDGFASLKGHLSLGSLPAKAFAAMQQKAFVAAGSTVLDVELLAGVQLAGRAPTSLLDVIPTAQRTSPVYRFLQETTRTPNAGPVAPGAAKPVSVFTISSVDAHLKVIATLSEPMDRFVLLDSVNLSQFLQSELVDAVQHAIENQIINGEGTGENFTGLNSISGAQVASGVDLVTGLRSAITALQGVSILPSFFAVNPVDFEVAQTTRTANGSFDWAVAPVDAGRQQAWGYPIIPTAGVATGTAWALGQGSVQLSTDARMLTDWGTPNDTFTKNQVVLRAETRANLDALRPAGIVKITITGP